MCKTSVNASRMEQWKLSTTLRQTFYEKNHGETDCERSGLMTLRSPISGSSMVVTGPAATRVRDPLTGTNLEIQNGKAAVTAAKKQQALLRSRKFYINNDVDIAIQEMRRTVHFNRKTNEKIGTSGSPTGMDPCLKMYLNS